ncbi:S41 family peptidase [uncultured Mucilaginibacter sp.]|uniref:S41 family peptidase n=1 Tax=uncultured Mucilaginibacter sp. TaxID=797541 RepID=UPI00260D3B92|nr:S41 family peptidase [uncultured Mucilaginibacter sp.]
MPKNLSILCFAFFLAITPAAFAQSTEKTIVGIPYYSDPAVSPDGSEIAFTSGGDIWTVPAAGGEAHLLISDPAYDSRPVYSPDGKYLAFNSTRTGNGDIYSFNLKNNELKRLTFDDGNDGLSAWSPDGKYVYFSTTSHDISGMNDIYRVKTTGGTPMPVSENRYQNEFFAMPSPDGKTLALNARGIAAQQWWRKGSSHLDQSEIWLMKDGKTNSYQKITAGGAKELWPMWSKDGASVYYISDRGGAQNLWVKTVSGTPKKLTNFTKGRVLWPTIAQNGKTIVFERDFKIWKYDVASAKASEVNIVRRGSPAGPGTEHQKLTTQFRGLQLSPDGKKVAFVAHGDVFVASAKEGGDALRVTQTGANESQLLWSPGSNTLVYVSDREDAAHLYQYNFITAKEVRLTNGDKDDAAPIFSPDGKMLAFVRDGKELHVLNLQTHQEKVVAKGYLGRPPFTTTGSISWSPDGSWLAYGAYGAKTFYNVYVVPVAGGESKAVSFLANTFGGDVNWSNDGKYILFNTSQRTENGNVARIDLVPQRPRFREDQFQQMFVDENTSPSSPVNPATSKPSTEKKPTAIDSINKTPVKTVRPAAGSVKIVMEGIRQRLNLLPLGVDVNDLKMSKDGKTILVMAATAGQSNLYTYSLDELATEPAALKQITTTRAPKADAQFSADGKELFYLEQGKIQSVPIDTKTAKPLAVTAETDIDFNKEKTEIFTQAWKAQNKGFYDEHFHGTNWNEVRREYAPLAAGSSTPDELRRLLSLMVGELNASHSGISGATPLQTSTGRLGLRFDPEVYENSGKFKITEVLSLSAADLVGNIHVGDYLTAIDDQPIKPTDNLDQLLDNKISRRVSLTIGSGADTHKVTVRPVSLATEKGLLYKQWVQQQRNYVNKISNGRLGYVHLFDMSEQSLNQFYLDLDAENQSKDGVIVDVRNNNGGFVNAYALDVLTRKPYLTMAGRGMPAGPARTQLGQRTLELPTILVTNQHSLSDAEDFTEGYRTMGLGKVVGEPTGGWIIFTSSVTLVDGSVLRMPFSRITDHEGKDMELHPRPVDLTVSRQLGEGNAKDSQLDVAAKELLLEVGAKKSR